MDAINLLEKLRQTGPTSPLTGLAELSVDALLDLPMSAWASQAEVASWGRRLLSGFVASSGAQAALTRLVEELFSRLQRERRPVEAVLPRDLKLALREVVRRPFSPDRRLVLTIIDREPFRALVREILVEAVVEFGRRASAPVAGMARGLGTLARMAQETVKSRSGGLGSLVGAVGSEVERQLEKRAVEFVDTALTGVLGQLADAVADPRRAEEASELRLSLFDGVLALTGPQLARELMNADLPGAVELLQESLSSWVASKDADEALAAVGAFLLSLGGSKTGRAQLEELGVLSAARQLAVEQTLARLQHVVGTAAFAGWLEAWVTSAKGP